VPLDQVVVAGHEADEIGKLGGAVGIQTTTEIVSRANAWSASFAGARSSNGQGSMRPGVSIILSIFAFDLRAFNAPESGTARNVPRESSCLSASMRR
jgi:hypothetical protein